MDGREFDNWARKLARLRSRRDVLKGLGATALGGALAGRFAAPGHTLAQAGPSPFCDGAAADTACGTGCQCADYVGGGGACYQTADWCGNPGGCNSDADCPSLFICATNDASLDCAPSGFAGICVLPCFVPATTTTTTTAPTTTTAAPTTTTAAPTTTTAAPTTTTTAVPTTTTTTTPGPTTTTTTTAPPPGVTVDPVRGTVGSTFDITLAGFPANTQATVSFVPSSGPAANLGTVETNAAGGATATRTVPTVPGGDGEIHVVAGSQVESADFEVAPRVRVTPATVARGQSVAAAVTGFGPAESVLIRWRVGTSYVQVGTLTTDATGSGTVNVTVPGNAALGANTVRADGTEFAAQTNAVTVAVPPPPAVTLSPQRGTVNSTVDYTVANFPASSTVAITWRRTSGSIIDIGTVQTDATGAAAGSFPVPATPGGPGQVVTFTSGSVSAQSQFEVAPRIKVATGAVGDAVDVSLRGFGRQESVRIRWLIDGSWIEVDQVTTSNTGSANKNVTIPAGAVVGANSVRGDGAVFRAQTNAAQVVAA